MRMSEAMRGEVEDVERGAELSFLGPRVRFADPSASSSNFVFKRPNFGFRLSDGRTDRRNKTKGPFT